MSEHVCNKEKEIAEIRTELNRLPGIEKTVNRIMIRLENGLLEKVHNLEENLNRFILRPKDNKGNVIDQRRKRLNLKMWLGFTGLVITNIVTLLIAFR